MSCMHLDLPSGLFDLPCAAVVTCRRGPVPRRGSKSCALEGAQDFRLRVRPSPAASATDVTIATNVTIHLPLRSQSPRRRGKRTEDIDFVSSCRGKNVDVVKTAHDNESKRTRGLKTRSCDCLSPGFSLTQPSIVASFSSWRLVSE